MCTEQKSDQMQEAGVGWTTRRGIIQQVVTTKEVLDTDPFGWEFKLPRRLFDTRGYVEVWDHQPVKSRSHGRSGKPHHSGGLCGGVPAAGAVYDAVLCPI